MPKILAEELGLTKKSDAHICFIDSDYVSLIVFEDWLFDGIDDNGNPKIAYQYLLKRIDDLRNLIEKKQKGNAKVKRFHYRSWIL